MKGVIVITRKKKNSTRKWNRTHFFQNEKKLANTKGKFREHPALIFEQSGNQYKAIIFTSNKTTNGVKNIKLKHNVDPNSSEDCYGVRFRGPRPISEFQNPKIKYRVHKEDLLTIKMLKAHEKKKK